MMRRSAFHLDSPSPPARLTLRAHPSAPAQVELFYNPTARRLCRAIASLIILWGAIPVLLWLPPHYPWVVAAFLAGLYLAHHSWKGRFTIRAFAGVCPRCGAALRLGVDRTVDLPHTLTCYSCHFEPSLEVSLSKATAPEPLEHQLQSCTGKWTRRWLADVEFVFCEHCHAGRPATPANVRAAEEENRHAELLSRLTDEGWPLV